MFSLKDILTHKNKICVTIMFRETSKYEFDSYDSISHSIYRNGLIKFLSKSKLKTIKMSSTRRPEHSKIISKDFYDPNKNKKLLNYLNKQRNFQTRYELYEQCFEILAVNNIKLNSYNMAFDLGCGSMKHNMVIYKHLNEKYFKKPIFWFGIDAAKFMLEFSNNHNNFNQLENFESDVNNVDMFNRFEYILHDLPYMDKLLHENISFELGISVAMLQWLSNSRFIFDTILKTYLNRVVLFG